MPYCVQPKSHIRRVAVIGCGYVGLALVVALADKMPVLAFDIDADKITALQQGQDVSGEWTTKQLSHANIVFTHQPQNLSQSDFYILAIPTPVDAGKQPDLTLLERACRQVGAYLSPGDIVVIESTVYPGVTEDLCALWLAQASDGLQCGRDFSIAYSPERINPGDQTHQMNQVIKVIAAQDKATLDVLAAVYGAMVGKKQLFRAESIQVAEMAKVLENSQRDLNIALINEIAMICHKTNIDTHAVLETAATKWNFSPYSPGLVGGHCIGVDPYYLAYRAQVDGHYPEVLLAGRRINDSMAEYVAQQTVKLLLDSGVELHCARVAVLGVAYKENCRDVRNSQAVRLYQQLKKYCHQALLHDPVASPQQIADLYQLELMRDQDLQQLDAIILAVPHQDYLNMSVDGWSEKLSGARLLVDVKSVLDHQALMKQEIQVWRL